MTQASRTNDAVAVEWRVIPATPKPRAGWRIAGAVVLICMAAVAILYGGVLLLFFELWRTGVPLGDMGFFNERSALLGVCGAVLILLGAALIVLAVLVIRSRHNRWRFNPPPTWPRPPARWVTATPVYVPPTWPPAPPGWQFWVDSRAR